MTEITPERIAAAREKGRGAIPSACYQYAISVGVEDIPKREAAMDAALDRLIAFERAEAVWKRHAYNCDCDILVRDCIEATQLLAAIEAIEAQP